MKTPEQFDKLRESILRPPTFSERIRLVLWWPYRFWHNEVRYVIPRTRNAIDRARRGWGGMDVWCADEYLSEVIEGMCRHLADVAHGYPDKWTFETWVAALREIADALKAYRNYEDNEGEGNEYPDWNDAVAKDAYFKRGEELRERQRKALHIFADNFNSICD